MFAVESLLGKEIRGLALSPRLQGATRSTPLRGVILRLGWWTAFATISNATERKM